MYQNLSFKSKTGGQRGVDCIRTVLELYNFLRVLDKNLEEVETLDGVDNEVLNLVRRSLEQSNYSLSKAEKKKCEALRKKLEELVFTDKINTWLKNILKSYFEKRVEQVLHIEDPNGKLDAFINNLSRSVFYVIISACDEGLIGKDIHSQVVETKSTSSMYSIQDLVNKEVHRYEKNIDLLLIGIKLQILLNRRIHRINEIANLNLPLFQTFDVHIIHSVIVPSDDKSRNEYKRRIYNDFLEVRERSVNHLRSLLEQVREEVDEHIAEIGDLKKESFALLSDPLNIKEIKKFKAKIEMINIEVPKIISKFKMPSLQYREGKADLIEIKADRFIRDLDVIVEKIIYLNKSREHFNGLYVAKKQELAALNQRILNLIKDILMRLLSDTSELEKTWNSLSVVSPNNRVAIDDGFLKYESEAEDFETSIEDLKNEVYQRVRALHQSVTNERGPIKNLLESLKGLGNISGASLDIAKERDRLLKTLEQLLSQINAPMQDEPISSDWGTLDKLKEILSSFEKFSKHSAGLIEHLSAYRKEVLEKIERQIEELTTVDIAATATKKLAHDLEGYDALSVENCYKLHDMLSEALSWDSRTKSAVRQDVNAEIKLLKNKKTDIDELISIITKDSFGKIPPEFKRMDAHLKKIEVLSKQLLENIAIMDGDSDMLELVKSIDTFHVDMHNLDLEIITLVDIFDKEKGHYISLLETQYDKHKNILDADFPDTLKVIEEIKNYSIKANPGAACNTLSQLRKLVTWNDDIIQAQITDIKSMKEKALRDKVALEEEYESLKKVSFKESIDFKSCYKPFTVVVDRLQKCIALFNKIQDPTEKNTESVLHQIKSFSDCRSDLNAKRADLKKAFNEDREAFISKWDMKIKKLEKHISTSDLESALKDIKAANTTIFSTIEIGKAIADWPQTLQETEQKAREDAQRALSDIINRLRHYIPLKQLKSPVDLGIETTSILKDITDDATDLKAQFSSLIGHVILPNTDFDMNCCETFGELIGRLKEVEQNLVELRKAIFDNINEKIKKIEIELKNRPYVSAVKKFVSQVRKFLDDDEMSLYDVLQEITLLVEELKNHMVEELDPSIFNKISFDPDQYETFSDMIMGYLVFIDKLHEALIEQIKENLSIMEREITGRNGFVITFGQIVNRISNEEELDDIIKSMSREGQKAIVKEYRTQLLLLTEGLRKASENLNNLLESSETTYLDLSEVKEEIVEFKDSMSLLINLNYSGDAIKWYEEHRRNPVNFGMITDQQKSVPGALVYVIGHIVLEEIHEEREVRT